MKKFLLILATMMMAVAAWSQGVKPLPTLHVEGRWLVDQHGNHVVLHGVMDTPNKYINGWRWGTPWDGSGTGYNATGVTKCKNYFEKLFAGLEEAKCNIFRLHLDPAWTNSTSDTYVWEGSEGQADGVGGEADITKFTPSRLTSYMKSLYFPLAKRAMNHGMFVVMRPPGVCPDNLKVGDYYPQYLVTVWDLVTKNDSVKKYSGQISIELANEPISIRNADNQDDPKALHDYFQPVVDRIRANGFSGIIWVPGTGWQANYTSYASYPIEGYNIGYAVHDYPGWYGCSDNTPDPTSLINQFHTQVPVVDNYPIFISEVDWSPEDPTAEGHYDEHGNWVLPNLGTWGTASTSKWGVAYKALLDHYGNISMTLTHPHEFLNIDALLETGAVVPAFDGNPEACGQACMEWYADYWNVDWPHADFKNVGISDLRIGRYKNPVIAADFPDPDVVRVGDTFYMISTTMHHFPGATILKSHDLVNWEYCAQPLTQLSTNDSYSLLNNENAYARGMWACSMAYHNGKFYILLNGNDAGGFVLSAEDPEGKWDMKALPRIYYDPGMLFDNGKVYVACGIGNIQMCELDENFNYIREANVISDKDGLEGSHLYKIGNYYYIYATYGGWPSGQAVFRSENIFGPYEEKMLVEKVINSQPNTVHQGALFDTPTGQWWTILQEDKGCLGRMPNLQPVKWEDDWPVVGNNGVPYTSYTKPNVGSAYPREALPTNDNFRSYPLGMQWQWNHNPDNGAWSLFDRPGWMRLKTSGVVNRLTQARNMLTQRIFAFTDRPSKGTVCMDVSNLQEGNRAGICILQDPYAMIAVEKKDGQYQLVWRQDTLRVRDDFTPEEQTLAIEPNDGIIYLRATVNYSTSKTQFYYSLDNVNYSPLGKQTTLGFSLTVFVGARYGLFCYATQENEEQGYADFDWFTNEDSFEETMFYPAEFEGFNEDMLTMVDLTLEETEQEVMVGNGNALELIAAFRDGHTSNVASQARYVIDEPGIVEVHDGLVRGLREGTAHIHATYTDPLGNERTKDITVHSTFFPFSAQYIRKNIFGNGTYDEATRSFHPSENGQMGWVYSSGADMSGYKYLIVKLKATSNNSHLNIYPSTNIWGDCYSTDAFGLKRRIIVRLQEALYTSGGKTGQPLDASNVCIVAFWGTGSQYIKINEMYLTNNDDYSPEVYTGIDTVEDETTTAASGIYDLQGRKVLNPQRGLYIVNGKKVVIK